MRGHFDPVTLRMFIAVCEERNIARAAERESIVASAISKRVAAMEEDVGVPLLKRGHVKAGLGIAIVPREAADPYARALGLRVVALTDPWAARHFVICMRSRDALTATARVLVDYLHQRARDST